MRLEQGCALMSGTADFENFSCLDDTECGLGGWIDPAAGLRRADGTALTGGVAGKSIASHCCQAHFAARRCPRIRVDCARFICSNDSTSFFGKIISRRNPPATQEK